MGVGYTVWTDKSVAVKVVIAGVVIVIIATVRIDSTLFITQSLVDEVPHKTSLEFRIFAYQVPIFFQTSARIAHGMIVFALDERLLISGCSRLCILFTCLLRTIHGTIHFGVGTLFCTFPMNGTRFIHTLNPVERCREVRSINRFVPHRPHNDARMVVVHLHVMLIAFQYLLSKHGFFSWRIVSILEAMTLLVGFCHHIKSILITQIIPLRVVWIVASTHCIDIELLHDLYVLYHAFSTHNIPTIRIHLMSIDSFYIDGLSINEQLAVFYLYFLEAYALRYHLNNLVTFLYCCQ